MKHRPAKASLVTVDGLRLIALDSVSSAPYWGHGRWHERDLISGGEPTGTSPTLLQLHLLAPRSQWQAEQSVLNAVLSSLRLTTPKGGWPGS